MSPSLARGGDELVPETGSGLWLHITGSGPSWHEHHGFFPTQGALLIANFSLVTRSSR